MNRNGIVDRTITLGGGKDLPRKTVREALDFMIQEMTDCLLSGKGTGGKERSVQDRASERERPGRDGVLTIEKTGGKT